MQRFGSTPANIGVNSLESMILDSLDSRTRSPDAMEPRETLRSTLPLVIFAVLAGSMAWACFGDRGLLTNRALHGELEVRAHRLEEQRQNVRHLRRQIERMKTDFRVQERWVRQELGYVKPGELLYLFPGDREGAFASWGQGETPIPSATLGDS